jgi:hypothetical protein
VAATVTLAGAVRAFGRDGDSVAPEGLTHPVPNPDGHEPTSGPRDPTPVRARV